MGWFIYLIPVFIFGIILLFSTFFIVRQQTAAIIETFGKYSSIRNAGLQLKIPLVQRIAARMNLKIQQLDVLVETKTKDDVFVKLKISVQFQFQRLGYFVVDTDSTADKIIFNRTVPLRDSWGNIS